MEIIVESHIPFIAGRLEPIATVRYLAPEEITPQAVRSAHTLIVRTRTRCNAALLDGSAVSHIVTATIGTDHIDLDYCRARGIRVDNAPGCNAPAVAQYVLAALGRLMPQGEPLTLGIVGVGHVGGIVDRWARANGIRTLLCDPPRAAAEGSDAFVSLGEIAERCDAVTFHTPLDASTRHMADARFFASLRRRPVVINAARGPVVDTEALVAALQEGRVSHAVIDCWEDEPQISPDLLRLATIATPHIAGYSAQGKLRATAMAICAVAPQLAPELPVAARHPALADITASYDPMADTARLKAEPFNFELIRNTYNYRNEPSDSL